VLLRCTELSTDGLFCSVLHLALLIVYTLYVDNLLIEYTWMDGWMDLPACALISYRLFHVSVIVSVSMLLNVFTYF